MTYKIKSTRQVQEVLYTEVEYSFDETILTVEIAHFNPQSTAEITQNILNRAATELSKITMVNQVANLLDSIEVDVTKEINI